LVLIAKWAFWALASTLGGADVHDVAGEAVDASMRWHDVGRAVPWPRDALGIKSFLVTFFQKSNCFLNSSP
jgi:hypothetical protein